MSTDLALKSLERYAVAEKAVLDHIEENKQLFDAHQQLVLRMMDARSALEDAVIESKEGVSDGIFTVTLVPQPSYLDTEAVKKMIGEGGSIDKVGLEAMITSSARAPRVSISKRK